MPFKYNADGSLDLYFQNESPGAEMEATGCQRRKARSTLVLCRYAPRSKALNGKWAPPPVTRLQQVPGLTAQ
jgi:hypothetical protein